MTFGGRATIIGKKRLPVQSVFAWIKFHAFCKKHYRRVCSLLRAKREPERTAVPAGHESPSGAFKPQTGLQSKCRVFSAARSPLLSRRGRRRVAAPCVRFVPWAALASCRPLPQQLLPVSAAGRGRRRCKLGAARPFQTPKLLGSIQKIQVAPLKDFLCCADFKAPQSLCDSSPQGSERQQMQLLDTDPSREKANKPALQGWLVCNKKIFFR